ncbi:MAG: hypothetical protein PHW64_03835 [Sulfuricurvum sp.]|nr:hypothetical protein [Sulfuricurvum sp.]
MIIAGCASSDGVLPYPLTVSEEGLGSIHPDTPFEEVNTRLVGFTFDKLTQISPEHPEIIFRLKRGNTVFAQILSDNSGKKIARMDILSPLIKNKHRLGLDDPLPQIAEIECRDHTCRYREEPSLMYTIDDNRIIREITYQRL